MSLKEMEKVANNCIPDNNLSVIVDCDISETEDRMTIEVSSDAPDNLKLQLAVLTEGMINILSKIQRDIGDGAMIEELRASLERIPQGVYLTTHENIKDNNDLMKVQQIADKYMNKPKK